AIFLTTQYLEEADQLADRIAVLYQGQLVAQGTADQLKRMVPGGYIRLDFGDRAEFESAARLFGDAAQVNGDLTLAVPSDGAVRSVREVIDRLDAARVEPAGLSVHTPDLDDVFLALTGGHAPEKETSQWSR
ncbi:ABC transporter, partial [Streptomyces sp. NPDC059083]